MSDPVFHGPARVRIVFDGGSLNNPGHGYGSYWIAVGALPPRVVRLDFGSPVTNNEAEYRALIHALEDALSTLHREGADPRLAQLEVRGDSQLVIRQLRGEWKVRMPNLRPLWERAGALLGEFGAAELLWQPRAESVRLLGH